MNEKLFFDEIRKTIFGKLNANQVNGINTILKACDDLNVVDLRQRANLLATPMIETGGSFVPVTENLNYSVEALRAKFPNRITAAEANKYGRKPGQAANQPMIANIIYGGEWGKKNLGNVTPGAGWATRGRGLAQITGERNYKILGDKLGIDLLKKPELAAELETAAHILVVGSRDGLFTGKKLSDYFTGNKTEWFEARRIINGIDRAADLEKDSRKFYDALKKAA